MYNLIRAEFYRLRYSKELKLSILLICFLGIVTLYFHGNITGRENLLSGSTDMFSLIACAVFAGMYVGSEFSRRTIYHLVISGHSRFYILISKFIGYIMGCLTLIIVNFIINGGIYGVFYGWSKSLDSKEILFITMYILINTIFLISISSVIFIVPIIVRDGMVGTVVSAFIMGIFLAISQTFWSYISIGIASGIKSDISIYIILLMLMIPIIAVFISNIIFKIQDIK